ncbi:MAG: hypothetical protein PVG09_04565, partial [Thiohalocapsa sp.]
MTGIRDLYSLAATCASARRKRQRMRVSEKCAVDAVMQVARACAFPRVHSHERGEGGFMAQT